MTSLHVWSSARFSFTVPEGHRFIAGASEMLEDAVTRSGVIPATSIHVADRVNVADLLRVHTADYVRRFTGGELSTGEIRTLGLPWSPGLVERSYRSTGATLSAARAALSHGIAMNLGGGTHHAFPDHGEGFCAFNDVAVAIRAMQTAGQISRAIVIDLDVHQGNGTNAIFAGDDRVFTLNFHGRNNFPFERVRGDLDIDFADGTQDEEYLATLRRLLPDALDAGFDIAFYIAGADPHSADRLGRLAMTFDGLAQRDAFVMDACCDAGIPLCVMTGGGYGARSEDSTRIHLATVHAAAASIVKCNPA